MVRKDKMTAKERLSKKLRQQLKDNYERNSEGVRSPYIESTPNGTPRKAERVNIKELVKERSEERLSKMQNER